MGDVWSQMIDYLRTDAAWSGRNGLPALLWNHIQLSAATMLFATLVAIPPAVWLGHRRRGAFLTISIVNIGRAIPTLAVIVLVVPFSLRWGFGLGFWPTLVALVLLAMPPIFTNTYTGVREAPADAVDAARGMGMRERELVRHVELPAALPLILTGLRVSAVQVVATATLGAFAGYRSLGLHIIAGFQRADKGAALASAIAVVLLALTVDRLFAYAQRVLVPWQGRRRSRARVVRPTSGRDHTTATAV
jgi:osmoprotectant transport system permease protein